MGLLFLQPAFLVTIPVSLLLAAVYILRLRKSVAIRVTGERFEVLKAAAIQRGTAGHFLAPFLLMGSMVLLSVASADPLYTFAGGGTLLAPWMAAGAGVLIMVSVVLRRR
ncbi:MAG: hypothetical protein QXO51_07095 [Halobacteria archaeon]